MTHPRLRVRRRTDGAADEICATPGLDGILIGTSDLTLSLGGAISDMQSLATINAVRTIVEACRRHGVRVAAYGGSHEMAIAFADLGIGAVALAADYEVLAAGAQAAVTQAVNTARDAHVHILNA